MLNKLVTWIKHRFRLIQNFSSRSNFYVIVEPFLLLYVDADQGWLHNFLLDCHQPMICKVGPSCVSIPLWNAMTRSSQSKLLIMRARLQSFSHEGHRPTSRVKLVIHCMKRHWQGCITWIKLSNHQDLISMVHKLTTIFFQLQKALCLKVPSLYNSPSAKSFCICT